MRKLKIFVLGLPQCPTTPRFAGTQGFLTKILDQCAMFHSEGHKVSHIGVEGSEVDCTEHVSVIKHDEWEKLYGKQIATNPMDGELTRIDGPFEPYHREFIKRTKIAILERCEQNKEAIICVAGSGSHLWAAEGTNQIIVEAGIGYPVASIKDYRIYESYAWLHAHLGMEKKLREPEWYWAVIPAATNEKLYRFEPIRGDHFLYFGRMSDKKGIQIAIDAAKNAGRRITICGYGDHTRYMAGHVDYHPPATPSERAELLANSRCLFCPTTYVEPHGRIAIEAMLSGSPIITTDFGGFSETCLHGTTGYRCRTMDQFTWAAKNIDKIRPETCRDWAMNFTPKKLAPMYTEYFNSVMFAQNEHTGWNTFNPERKNIDWLNKKYPAEWIY